MRSLVIHPPQTESIAGGWRRSCRIERLDDGRPAASDSLWYELPESVPPPPEADAEAFLLATIMVGMAEGRSIRVRGATSRTLLSNLTEFRDAWHAWVPNRYQRIDFEPDEVIDAPAHVAPASAISAFSGGVDGTFTVWRHATGRAGYRTAPIRLCVMVHGFDIPLADEDGFRGARERAVQTLADLRLPLLTLRTNFRQVVKTEWGYVFAAALAAGLQMFKEIAGVGLVGSSEPYDSLVIPWGSNPITDHLLSSDTFAVVHDGAGFSRTDKVAAVAEWDVGRDALRVCWMGQQRDRNCGQCEKCLRTMLNFRANGLPIPSCFPKASVSAADVKRVALPNRAIVAEWRQLLDTALRNGIADEWVPTLRRRVRPNRGEWLARSLYSRARAQVRQMTRRLDST
jgi:hypothetical protein